MLRRPARLGPGVILRAVTQLDLDRRSKIATSAQLVQALAERIGDGRLLPGNRLPPVRALAETLRLAPNTVAKAYRELEREGLLTGRGRAGTFVAERTKDRGDPERELAKAAAGYLRLAARLGFDRAAAVRALRDA